MDQVYRFPTEQIQTFDVGYTPDEASATNKIVLWTVPHTKEENFLVANRDTTPLDAATNNDRHRQRPPPVSLLTVSIPVQFQITNLTAWVYNNDEPDTLLQHIAAREVVRYLVSVDLGEVMSRGRAGSGATLCANASRPRRTATKWARTSFLSGCRTFIRR